MVLLVLGQETAILEEDEEDINGMLQYVDVDTRTRIVHGIKRLKQRYGNMVLHAQHEKHNVEKVSQTRNRFEFPYPAALVVEVRRPYPNLSFGMSMVNMVSNFNPASSSEA